MAQWHSPTDILRRYDLKASKARSQNFIVSRDIAHTLVSRCKLKLSDTVVEIGPGAGALTGILAEFAHKVIAIELDRGLVVALRDMFVDEPKIEIIEGDALEVDYPQLLKGSQAVAVGNLPYGISAPLLRSLLNDWKSFSAIHVLLQKEVAYKFAEPPGNRDCSPLGILLHRVFKPSMGMRLSPGNFFPKPEVDSQVLHLHRRTEPMFVADDFQLERLLHAAFVRRRKKLVSNIATLGMPKDDVIAAIEAAGLRPDIRAEAVPMDAWGVLYTQLMATH